MDESHVYWSSGETLMRGSLASSEVVEMARDEARVEYLALDGDWVYALSSAGVVRVPKAGGEVDILATGNYFPAGLQIVGSSYYLLDRRAGSGDPPPSSGILSIRHIDDLVSVDVVAPGLVRDLVADAAGAYFLSTPTDGELSDVVLMHFSPTEKTIETIPVQHPPRQIALTPTDLVYAAEIIDGATVRTISRSTGEERELGLILPEPSYRLDGIAVDEVSIYLPTNYVDYNYGISCASPTVWRVPLDGGGAEILGEYPDWPHLNHPATRGPYIAFAAGAGACDPATNQSVHLVCKPTD